MPRRRARPPADQRGIARVLDAPVGGAVRLRPASEQRVSVLVGGRSIGTMSADAAEALGLRPGRKWTPELSLRVARAVERDQAERAAARLLRVRERSRGELLSRLKRRGVKQGDAERLVAGLERAGKVDDERFARLRARSIIRKRPAGARLIRDRLRSDGVGAAAAERAAKEALSGRDPLEDALTLGKSRLLTMPPGLDDRVKARRLLGLLARRGFDEEAAMEVVRRLLPFDGGDA